MNENDRHEAFEATAQGELYREVVDIYAEPENFPREEASPFAERILQLIDKAVAARDAEIREALLSDEVVVAAGDVIAGEFYADLPMMTGEAYSQVAKTALQAAAVEPEPGIDELLDSVSPKANMWTAADPTGGYAASIRFPKKDGEWVTIPATGPTRIAAIQNAVEKANR